MCSAIKFKTCFGRNYDYEQSFDEEIITIPKDLIENDYEIMGIVSGQIQEYPLFYDGMNSEGLAMAGLNFAGNTQYQQNLFKPVPVWNLIPTVLGKCKNVSEAKEMINSISVINKRFKKNLPNGELHFMIADSNEAIVVEYTKKGLMIKSSNIMTNNPPIEDMILTAKYQNNKIGEKNPIYINKKFHSRGMETLGLPGSYTSLDRFSRLKWLSERMNSRKNPLIDTFHLLSSTEQINGITHVDRKYEYTIYSVVYDMKDKRMVIKKYDELEYKTFEFTQEYNRVRL